MRWLLLLITIVGVLPALLWLVFAVGFVVMSEFRDEWYMIGWGLAGVLGYIAGIYTLVMLFRRRRPTRWKVIGGISLGLLALLPLLLASAAYLDMLTLYFVWGPFTCGVLLIVLASRSGFASGSIEGKAAGNATVD